MDKKNDKSPIDPATFRVLVEMVGSDEAGVMLHLIDSFRKDSVRQVGEMKESLALRDHATLHRLAHTLKSSSSILGAKPLSQLCGELERLTENDCEDGRVAELIAQVELEHQHATAILRQERNHFVKAKPSS